MGDLVELLYPGEGHKFPLAMLNAGDNTYLQGNIYGRNVVKTISV